MLGSARQVPCARGARKNASSPATSLDPGVPDGDSTRQRATKERRASCIEKPGPLRTVRKQMHG